MACRISELVVEAADPDRLAAFWSEVLGYVELGREDDGSIEIGPPDAGFGGLNAVVLSTFVYGAAVVTVVLFEPGGAAAIGRRLQPGRRTPNGTRERTNDDPTP